MSFSRLLKTSLFTLFFLLNISFAWGKIQIEDFNLVVNAQTVNETVQNTIDSLTLVKNVFGAAVVKNEVIHSHNYSNRTIDFYLLNLLFVFLGIIRLTDPKYFFEILQSFMSSNLSNRQAKDRVLQKSFSNFIMNLFFVFSASVFSYFLLNSYSLKLEYSFDFHVFFTSLFSITALYLGKYIVIKFSGWAFNLENVTEQYLFNVFLVNKILGIVLLPLVFLIAFSLPLVSKIVIGISICLIFAAFILRYFRSWKVFSAFFNFSKFHFFTYICASELVPIAVLVKLLRHGLI